jgi:spore coat protein U-like protein
MKTMIRLTVIAALIAISAPATAQTLPGSFNVTAAVAKTCVFQTGAVTDITFGDYDSFLSPEVARTTSFQFRCTNKTPYTIELGPGNNFSGTRRMAAGAEFLPYDLDQVGGPGWAVPWGTLADGEAKGGNAPNSTWMTHTVYGRIRAGQVPAAGSYSDSVAITVNY